IVIDMKVLIVDNAAMNYRFGKYFVYKTTGEFGKELKDLGHQVEYFQFRNERPSNSFFDLLEHKVKVSAVKFYSSKFFSYLIAYCVGFFRILRNDFVYIYYPDSFSYL